MSWLKDVSKIILGGAALVIFDKIIENQNRNDAIQRKKELQKMNLCSMLFGMGIFVALFGCYLTLNHYLFVSKFAISFSIITISYINAPLGVVVLSLGILLMVVSYRE